jgi:uncharacterized membrane protein
MSNTLSDLARKWMTRRKDQLTETEARVLRSAIDQSTISLDTNIVQEQSQSPGDRLADAIARIGGSWTFIVSFLLFLVVWAVANTVLPGRASFDPYPFIFLNLVLSMIAAIQAPVIMMSQNRQSERDRIAASHDYEVNLKAEIEIMALHEKFDEIRHMDIVLMREEVASLKQVLDRIEKRLGETGR